MPGLASLEVQQYYAHARNSFWSIMSSLLEQDIPSSYPKKRRLLINHRIALWDVIAACRRPGSLDADIESQSIVANDFASFFKKHRGISAVFFNGAKAESEFRRRVIPSLSTAQTIKYVRLLSTSPANAGYSFEQKLTDWSQIREHLMPLQSEGVQ